MAEEAHLEEETCEKAVLSPIPESMEVEAAADSSHGGDSESDSDSDSDSEADDKLQVQTLESELYNNPSNYDAHVQVYFITSDTAQLVRECERFLVDRGNVNCKFRVVCFKFFAFFILYIIRLVYVLVEQGMGSLLVSFLVSLSFRCCLLGGHHFGRAESNPSCSSGICFAAWGLSIGPGGTLMHCCFMINLRINLPDPYKTSANKGEYSTL